MSKTFLFMWGDIFRYVRNVKLLPVRRLQYVGRFFLYVLNIFRYADNSLPNLRDINLDILML